MAFPHHCVPLDHLDARSQAAIRKAEREDGFEYGARFLDGRECFVSVRFYPRKRWWIYFKDGNRRPLTRELFDRTERLKL